jgi:hypothetical protein
LFVAGPGSDRRVPICTGGSILCVMGKSLFSAECGFLPWPRCVFPLPKFSICIIRSRDYKDISLEFLKKQSDRWGARSRYAGKMKLVWRPTPHLLGQLTSEKAISAATLGHTWA